MIVRFKLSYLLLLLLSAALCLFLCACQTGSTKIIPTEPLIQDEKSSQQLLEEQSVDDTHRAFLVDTGGELGTLLVTAELAAEGKNEFGMRDITFSVWNPDSMDEPLQTLTSDTYIFLDWSVIDANFDGYMDFTCRYMQGIQAYSEHLWIWDEDRRQFEGVLEYGEIPASRLDEETKTIYGWARASAAGDGVSTFHRWESGELVCVRRIESSCGKEAATVYVADRIDGELQEVYYEEFPWSDDEPEGREAWRQAQYLWQDLDYHGTP